MSIQCMMIHVYIMHGLLRYDGLEPGKLQSHKIEDFCLMLNCTLPCTNLCLNFIKYYSLWLHVQLSLLDSYLIIRKYNELNHRDRAQININSDKNITQWLLFSFQTVISS
jgi:hypothetical protein